MAGQQDPGTKPLPSIWGKGYRQDLPGHIPKLLCPQIPVHRMLPRSFFLTAENHQYHHAEPPPSPPELKKN
ncbi:MAG: hypothetical protein HFG63_00020 [Lachnospiraceae bacterium]|nr:hypothetical protein [Lachnospiraceae bacterium]